jgi:hypothetical protein
MSAVVRTPVDDPAAWRGEDLAARNDWVISFDTALIAELDAALDQVEARGIEALDIRKEDFPLPRFSAMRDSILSALEGGLGFVLMRGLPMAHWDEARSRRVLYGLGTHLGWAEPQDGAGNRLHDVRDIGREFGSDDNIRYFQTSHAIKFHNDGADMFALCCLHAGRSGGLSRLVSAVELFNEIARRRPDLAEVLQQPFHFDARGQHPGGDRCQVIPIYSFERDAISIISKTDYIYSAQRFDGVPRLSAAQQEALELLKSIPEEPGMTLEFHLQQGDTLIASNHVALHGRTAFTDEPSSAPPRHMLRLWLTIPNGRPLPPHYADTREFRYTYQRRISAQPNSS